MKKYISELKKHIVKYDTQIFKYKTELIRCIKYLRTHDHNLFCNRCQLPYFSFISPSEDRYP